MTIGMKGTHQERKSEAENRDEFLALGVQTRAYRKDTARVEKKKGKKKEMKESDFLIVIYVCV